MRKIAKQKQLDRAKQMLGQLEINKNIRALMLEAGMQPDALLAEGQQLYTVALAQVTKQDLLCGKVTDLWAEMYRRHAAAWPAYMALRGVVKARYGRRGLAGLLGLAKPAARTRPRQLFNMDDFYRVALKEEPTITALARIGITRDELEAGMAAVRAMQRLDNTILEVEAHKQQATVDENRDLAALQRWHRRAYKYVELATEEHPGLMHIVKE